MAKKAKKQEPRVKGYQLKIGEIWETGCPRHDIRYPVVWNGEDWEGICPLCREDPPPESELEPLCRFFARIADAYFKPSPLPLTSLYRAVREALSEWEEAVPDLE